MIGRLLCALGLHAWQDVWQSFRGGPILWCGVLERCQRPGCKAERRW